MGVRTGLRFAVGSHLRVGLVVAIAMGCAVPVAAGLAGTVEAWPVGVHDPDSSYARIGAQPAAAEESGADDSAGDTQSDDASQLGVAAVAELTLREGPDQSVTDAYAYRLLLDQEVFAYPDGAGAGGLESGIGIIGLPRLTKQWYGSRRSTKIGITNLAQRPGFTDYVVLITDQNGVLDYIGEKLNERQTEFVDLDTWGYVNKGFVGSAFISAVFWEHDLFDDDGNFVRNTLGLSASVSDWSNLAGSHPGTASGARAVHYDTSLGVKVTPWKLNRPPALGSGPMPRITWTPTPGPSPTASATPTVTPTPTATPTPIVPPPYAPDSPEQQLPALRWRSPDAQCDVWADIQNAGAEESLGVMVSWGEPGECGAATCAGPLAATCTNAIEWDGGWRIDSDDLPAEARSAVLFSFNTKTMAEIGLGPGDGVVADVMCAMLKATLPGNCLEYERFKQAYDQGLDYNGLRQDLAWGSPLAVHVERSCDGPSGGPDLPLSGAYSGIWGPSVGYRVPDDPALSYTLPIAHGDSDGRRSVAHIQNAGNACASFEVRTFELAASGPSTECAAIELEAGASAMVDLSGCVSSAGSAWIESDEPLAVVVDSTANLGMSSYVGAPPHLADMHGRPLLSASGAIALAPSVASNYLGWNTEVTAQNTGAITSVLKLSVIDRSGDALAVRQLGPVAPGSSVSVDIAAVATVPSQWVGSVIVESFPVSAAPVATPWLGPEPTAPLPGPPPYPVEPSRTPGLPVPVTPGTPRTPDPTPTASATRPVQPTPTPFVDTPTPTPSSIHLPYNER